MRAYRGLTIGLLAVAVLAPVRLIVCQSVLDMPFFNPHSKLTLSAQGNVLVGPMFRKALWLLFAAWSSLPCRAARLACWPSAMPCSSCPSAYCRSGWRDALGPDLRISIVLLPRDLPGLVVGLAFLLGRLFVPFLKSLRQR